MIGFIPFPRVLGLCEMQSVSSRIYVVLSSTASQRHNNKDARKKSFFFSKKYTSHFNARVGKRVTQGLRVRGSWRPNRTEIFWPQTYGRHVVSFLFFWCSTRALGSTLLGAGFLYCILSATSLVPKLQRGSRGPPRPGVAFPTTSRLLRMELQLATANSTELYNRSTPTRSLKSIFNRHQAEITVMQFRGHSLLVHQSMSVPWELFGSSISSANFHPRDFLS